MKPLREWILWVGNTPKKLTEVLIEGGKFQRIHQKFIERKGRLRVRHDMALAKADKEALQILKKVNRI